MSRPSAKNICLCIDIDGFRLQDGTFITRELGWCDGEVKRVGSFHYDHGYRWENMSPTDRKTIQFVKNRVAGLPFRPSPDERRRYFLRRQEDLEHDILRLYNDSMEGTPKYCNVVAYKGGTLERNILNKLQIPSFNLEELSCPKYDVLAKLYGRTFNCKCHLVGDFHCSEDEAYMFMQWFKKHFWYK